MDKQVRNYEDEYFIPVSAYDSQWNGIFFELPAQNAKECQRASEAEVEIKVIDLDKSKELSPLLLLFPELKNTSSEKSNIESLSPASLTKMLKGKKPNLNLLKTAKRLSKPVSINIYLLIFLNIKICHYNILSLSVSISLKIWWFT